MVDKDPSSQHLMGTLTDEERAVLLSSALEQIADSVMITDTAGVILYVNDSFEVVTGYSRVEAIGQRPSLMKSGEHSPAFYRLLWSTLHAGRPFRHTFINRRKGGAIYHEAKTITPVRDADNRITHFVATGRDITDRVDLEARLERLAYTDSLTGLPNRERFVELLRGSLQQPAPESRGLAVLFMDMDGFKEVNDSYGHQAGDHLLMEVARRLRKAVQPPDVVARLGGDEFAMLLCGPTSRKRALEVADRVLRALEPPFPVGGVSTYVRGSIGIALAPGDGDEVYTLLKHADTAMYAAKARGGEAALFEPQMTRKTSERFSLRNDLRQALERQELYLEYQPQLDLQSGTVRGVEALLRWRHPSYGALSPAVFVPLLEESGLIHSVGGWVVNEACRQLRTWWAGGVSVPRMAVNVSPTQLEQGDFIGQVIRALRTYDLPPGALEVELVETANLSMLHQVEAGLSALSSAGVLVALDDFGTGFSALSHLQRFPVHAVKIDRDFVRALDQPDSSERLVQGMISVARGLALDIVAEGVESRQQLRRLRLMGCGAGQGFLFCRPSMPAAVAEFTRRCLSLDRGAWSQPG
ncbi:MAG: EAL domain-containing protein [Ectothiorhodospiraceae bacterium]|nr:EAL domain-containing protein [Ectothiorhodospiraceae bacterium]